MFDHKKSEIAAGAFLLMGVAALAYLSISIGGLKLFSRDSYRLLARFSNVGDLKLRASVKVAGELAVDRAVQLPTDTIASIATAGLLGESHVSLSPGAAEQNLAPGGRITHTEPALNMADLLSRYAFGNGNAAPPKEHP